MAGRTKLNIAILANAGVVATVGRFYCSLHYCSLNDLILLCRCLDVVEQGPISQEFHLGSIWATDERVAEVSE